MSVKTDIADRYGYRVRWSEQEQEFVGTCDEFPSLSCFRKDKTSAFCDILWLVYDCVRDMLASNETPPEPIAFDAAEEPK